MAPSILLIDADANFRRALRVALSLEGVAVGEAVTLDEARAALQQRRWDCAVVDLLLPCGEGPRAVELVESGDGVGLVACSSHPEVLAPLARRAVVLEKPFSPAVLLAAVAHFFQHSDRPRAERH
jgi:DNA-binding NtrC family response regulator